MCESVANFFYHHSYCLCCMEYSSVVVLIAGDHFYKENGALALEQQMITAMPDVQSRSLQPDDEFVVLACDGIW